MAKKKTTGMKFNKNKNETMNENFTFKVFLFRGWKKVFYLFSGPRFFGFNVVVVIPKQTFPKRFIAAVALWKKSSTNDNLIKWKWLALKAKNSVKGSLLNKYNESLDPSFKFQRPVNILSYLELSDWSP